MKIILGYYHGSLSIITFLSACVGMYYHSIINGGIVLGVIFGTVGVVMGVMCFFILPMLTHVASLFIRYGCGLWFFTTFELYLTDKNKFYYQFDDQYLVFTLYLFLWSVFNIVTAFYVKSFQSEEYIEKIVNKIGIFKLMDKYL